MDILELVQQNMIAGAATAMAVGGIQGAVLGRGIRSRFPALKSHARATSIGLSTLFAITAAVNVAKFAEPDKIAISQIREPETWSDLLDIAMLVLGVNAGLFSVAIFFISVSLMLLFRHAQLPRIARYFVFALGFATMALAVFVRLTDYVPDAVEVVLYAGYQFGITVGVFLVTRRKEKIRW